MKSRLAKSYANRLIAVLIVLSSYIAGKRATRLNFTSGEGDCDYRKVYQDELLASCYAVDGYWTRLRCALWFPVDSFLLRAMYVRNTFHNGLGKFVDSVFEKKQENIRGYGRYEAPILFTKMRFISMRWKRNWRISNLL